MPSLSHFFRAKCMMRLVSACLCWRDTFFFWSAQNFYICETVRMLRKSKQQAVQGNDRCACFAGVGTRSLRIGLQPVSQPNTTALKLTTTQPRVGGEQLHPDPRSSPVSKVLVTSRQSLSLSTRLLRHVSEQSKQEQRTVHVEIWTEKEANRPLCFVDLRHRPVGVYANEPLSGWKSRPLSAVKSALSHGDRDKLVSQPLKFELL